MLVLCGNGRLSCVQDDAATTKAKKHADKLNTNLMLRARSHNDLTFLASPVTEGGVAVGRFHQLFALALQQGKKKPADWAAFVEQSRASQGQKIVKEGKPIETTEQKLAELTSQANKFANKQLSVLKALQIV
jgi:hypothetical protein